jgi:hypothetical protein
MKSAKRITKVKRAKRRAGPSTVNGTVPPPRIENVKRRPREYLTVKEVGRLFDAARERQRGVRSGRSAPATPYLDSGRSVGRSDRPSSMVGPEPQYR